MTDEPHDGQRPLPVVCTRPQQSEENTMTEHYLDATHTEGGDPAIVADMLADVRRSYPNAAGPEHVETITATYGMTDVDGIPSGVATDNATVIVGDARPPLS